MFLFFLSLFLPGLNRDHCDDVENGYTCADLEHGVAELQAMLKEERHGMVGVFEERHPHERIFARVFGVGLALATGSTPMFQDYPSIPKPSFAVTGAKVRNPPELDFCANLTSIEGSQWFTVPRHPSMLLLNPTLLRVYKRLGPAALHILVHFTLNLNESYSFAPLDEPVNVNCPEQPGAKLPSKPAFHEILNASRAPIIQKLPEFTAFIVNLIRGRAPTLCDGVGHSCWKARSYIAGGVNPIYPGTGRSMLDISRSTHECWDTKVVQDIIDHLI